MRYIKENNQPHKSYILIINLVFDIVDHFQLAL